MVRDSVLRPEPRSSRSGLEGAGAGRDVDSVLLKHCERHDLECPLIGRCEHHVGRCAIFVRPQPVLCGHTPPISGHEAREVKLGHWGAEIVADATLMLEELSGGHRADRVAAPVLGPRPTAPISIEAGERVDAARLQLVAQYIAVTHLGIIAQEPRLALSFCALLFGSGLVRSATSASRGHQDHVCDLAGERHHEAASDVVMGGERPSGGTRP